jgi:hypothetical protein
MGWLALLGCVRGGGGGLRKLGQEKKERLTGLGSVKEKRRERGGSRRKKRPKRLGGKGKPFLFSKDFINCKLFQIQIKFEI